MAPDEVTTKMIFQEQYITLCHCVSSRASCFTKVAEDPQNPGIYIYDTELAHVPWSEFTSRRGRKPDVVQDQEAALYRFPWFTSISHSSVQNLSTLQLIYQLFLGFYKLNNY